MLTWLLVLLVVGVLGVALLGAALWGYAWAKLGADEVAALGSDVEVLGDDGARGPAEARTVLVATTGDRDPTLPRGPELVAPVWLVQAGGPRDVPALLLLPEDLPVSVDGDGVRTLAEVQVAGDANGLVQAVADYTGVRIDHVVSLEEEAIPRLVDHLGPVAVCGDDGQCRAVGADEARRDLAEASPEARAARTAALLRGVAAETTAWDLLWSPVATKRSIDTVADVHTDVALRGTSLLDLAAAFEDAPAPEVVTLPILRNPQTGSSVLLEQAETIFQRFAEGAPLDGITGDDGLQQLIGEVPVVVLNAAGIDGLAGRVEARLTAAGFQVVGTGNTGAFEEGAPSVIRYGADDASAEATAILLAERLPDAQLESVERVPDFEGEPVGVQVLAGADLDDGE
ncbi:LytR C-terminal domain-containing protein [Egicoccus sp. AB-alg6-2]|uniref:LytR C-terminal domain-containing protein n=1 Tax=Egicoccus sp. AB-alg6-2 TaxID=3242692 RepID=UPI00359E8109